MKNILFLVLLSWHLSSSAFAADRLVMVAPFDNLSDVRRHIDYETDTGAVKGNPRKRYQVDRYSHACREFLEDTISSIPGLRPVERAQFDRVMLEVAGTIHDGAVDPEKVQKIAIRLGADAIIMGTILDLKETISLYEGYARIKTTTYSATIRVRLIDLTKDADSQKIVAGIAASYRMTGMCVVQETPYFNIQRSDAYFAALVDALRNLEKDEAFKARIVPKPIAQNAPGLVRVNFEVMPTNCSVFVRSQSGWRYLGGTPLARSLPAGLELPIRIEKEGYSSWKCIIVPEPNLCVTHELHPLPAPKTTLP